MDMKQCAAGHFYDAEKNATCPYCAPAVSASVGTTVPVGGEPEAAPVIGQTVALSRGFNPVVGWLVCVSGPDRGKDYVIRDQNNYIGRDVTMDIRIAEDPTVSRESATLTYDRRTKAFLCTPEKGHAVVRVNDEILHDTLGMKANDRIEIGHTVLMLVPLCNDGFDWDWEPDDE